SVDELSARAALEPIRPRSVLLRDGCGGVPSAVGPLCRGRRGRGPIGRNLRRLGYHVLGPGQRLWPPGSNRQGPRRRREAASLVARNYGLAFSNAGPVQGRGAAWGCARRPAQGRVARVIARENQGGCSCK